MIDHLQRSEMFRKSLVHSRTGKDGGPVQTYRRMVRESTDPQFVREQLGQPHQYSKTFTVCMLFLGTAAAYGILFACASI